MLWLPEEKLWSRGKGKPSRCSFALHVLLLPQKLVDLQPWCESLVTSRSTVMILPVSFAESKLCHRQSRQQTLDAWNDTSQWNGHWQAEGRNWHKERPVLQHRWQPRTPHLELDLIILGTSDLQPSQLISSLRKLVFQEAGSRARVHG